MRLDGIDALFSDAIPATAAQTTVVAPIIVCNEEYRFLVLEQLQGVGRNAERVLLEPASRNTAPALTLAALAAAQGDRDPILVVMPADHVIRDLERFRATVVSALQLALEGKIVTFGIVPKRPETGYGYIRKGLEVSSPGGAEGFAIEAFVEKPDRTAALSYVSSGGYFWNSGLFVMLASVWLEAIARYSPGISDACRMASERGRADGEFFRFDRAAFDGCPSDSIDYAVMEPLTRMADGSEEGLAPIRAAVVPMDVGWSDVGAWPALLELGKPDTDGNVVLGDVYGHDTHDSILFSEHRFLAAIGVRDVIAVETADAVLIVQKDHSQDVRKVVEWLNGQGREEGRIHRRVYRPWGTYERLDTGDRFQVKRVTVKPEAALSLQMHHHRAEHWVVVRGTAKVTRGTEEFLLSENESTYIPLGVRHRLENPGKVPLEIIEVQSGPYLGEDDIVRFEDQYRRENDA